ncbi:MAG: Gfo/Idh/MocA family protein [Thermoguttaceae bacterium]
MKVAAATTAVVAAPLIVPARTITTCAQAQEQPLPNDVVRLGMIGTGRQCYHHNIPGFVRNKRCQVVALCDVDAWRLAESHKKVLELYEKSASLAAVRPKSVSTHIDYHEILERPDVDAVMISTPDHWHAVQALEAMRAGKHVALEKPIIRTFADGRSLVKTAAETQRIFRVDSEFRSGAGAHRAAELVRNGRLGKIHRVLVCVPESDVACPPQSEMSVPAELDYERWQGPALRAPYTLNRVHKPHDIAARPGWMRHLYYCDGMVTNWGTHLLNGALWSLGLDRTWPVEIEGTGVYPNPESFWNVLLKFEITYRYPQGVEVVYKTEKPYYRIEGEKGTIEVTFEGIKAEPESLLKETIGDDEVRFPLRSEKEDFIDSVLKGQETLEPAAIGHCVTSTCLLGHIAIRTSDIRSGQPLRWDADKETFSNSPEANEYLTTPITASR